MVEYSRDSVGAFVHIGGCLVNKSKREKNEKPHEDKRKGTS